MPGVGKTMLSKALARSIDCTVGASSSRPDLLPSDVTGVSIFNQNSREFEFRPGGVFANIVVGDEINRASPKTQSALLECMEERQVTVDNTTYQLETPFMVIATQNPIEMEGTYALPEAQRDRFMARLSSATRSRPPRSRCSTAHQVRPARRPRAGDRRRRDPQADRPVNQVYVSDAVQRYAVALTAATRRPDELTLGASPRATLHLVRAAKALAAMRAATTCCPTTYRGSPPGARPPPAAERRGSMSGRSTTAILDGHRGHRPRPSRGRVRAGRRA